MCLCDESVEIRRLALSVCEYRADMDADIGLAVPQLLGLRDDLDAETRRLARRALFYANRRPPSIRLTASL